MYPSNINVFMHVPLFEKERHFLCLQKPIAKLDIHTMSFTVQTWENICEVNDEE